MGETMAREARERVAAIAARMPCKVPHRCEYSENPAAAIAGHMPCAAVLTSTLRSSAHVRAGETMRQNRRDAAREAQRADGSTQVHESTQSNRV